MTAPPDEGERRCVFCHCLLAADRSHTSCVCTPCLSGRRDYDPACDPVFDRVLEELFLERPRQVLDPLALLGVSRRFKWSVRSSVRRLRRRGMHIEGIVHTGGYVYEPGLPGNPEGAGTPPRRLRGRRRP